MGVRRGRVQAAVAHFTNSMKEDYCVHPLKNLKVGYYEKSIQNTHVLMYVPFFHDILPCTLLSYYP